MPRGHHLLQQEPRFRQLAMLESLASPNTRLSYALTLDELFAFSAGRPPTRALLQQWKASMDALAPSTINVKLSAVRSLVGEARLNGLILMGTRGPSSARPSIVFSIRSEITPLVPWSPLCLRAR